MSLLNPFSDFARSECGAITVDWTVISAAAVSLALGTAGIMTDVTGMLSTNMNEELEGGDLADGWPRYFASYFQPMLDSGYMTPGQAEYLHNEAYTMMNNEVLTRLNEGLTALENGTITSEELAELVAIASMAHQRNLVHDQMLDHYFGFDGSDPYYMTTDNAPDGTADPYSGASCTPVEGQGCVNGGGTG